MREIKFRVWHTLDRRMIYEGWNEYVFVTKNEIFQLGETGVIMQYTGFKDTNNIDIYEGDIMGGNGQIIWEDWNGSFNLEGREWMHNMNYAHINYIVMGNIYENPEILLIS